MRRIPVRHRIIGERRAGAWLGAVAALAALLVACGDDEGLIDSPDAGSGADADVVGAPDATPVDESAPLFQPDHVLEISITLGPADWAVLRDEPETIGWPKISCGEQPTGRQYHYFPGDITVDGVTTTNVGVRKKGGFGSISSTRPGLKIKPTEYVPGQRIFGLTRLTLNNNEQDPTRISQCLGYALFAAAGVPASRCSFAHVTVNGEDLGVYSNVESIKKDFLRRHFADETGRLYESGGEFIPGATAGFQPKTNKQAPDCSDLDPVVAAVGAPDAQLFDQLDAVVDVDAFITYWAMEVLTDHWDGYANNRNNYFFYHDPTSDKLHFIPWGIDALFTGRERSTRPMSVFACGSMPWRLYDVADTRAMYLARLRDLLDAVWDEAALLAEIDRMEALITPIADPTGARGLAGEIQRTRDFVMGRRAVLLGELDAGDPVWPYAAGDASCRINLGTMNATFDTTWSTLGNYGIGAATTSGTIGGTPVDSTDGHANAGQSADGKGIVQALTVLSDGRYAVVYVVFQDPADVTPGPHALDLVHVAAFMQFYDPSTDTASGGGLMLGGTVTLTAADTTPGGAITGSLTSDVFEL